MKELINKEDFVAVTHLHKWKMEKAAHPLMRLTGIVKLNNIYNSLSDHQGLSFIDALFDEMEIDFIIDPDELEKIPKKGPFVTISNHPFGAIDSLLLLKLIAERRPDYKIISNFLLQHIEPLKDHFIFLHGDENEGSLASSIPGLKKVVEHINEGNSIGLFPAGEVSTFQNKERKITDRAWQRGIIKLVKKLEVPVIPIYFQGSNSAIFHFLGLVHPRLRTAILPSELFKKKRKEIRIRIGNPIPPRDQKSFRDIDRFGRFLRAKTYALGSALEVKKFFKPKKRPKKSPSYQTPVADPADKQQLLAEIEGLREQHLIFTQKNFEAFIAYASTIPFVLHELGRLREVTFREVGEGTNLPIDTDEYDLYYAHLFLWDKEGEHIVGAYRLGKGDEIIERFGKKGFYIESLFRIEDGFIPILEQSVELGRSFIVKEYQKNRLPLFLLWKGIVYFLKQHPECRYIIGPVSISNSYSKVSRNFIVAFIEAYYFDYQLAQYIRPRNAFKVKKKKETVDTKTLLDGVGADLKKVDKVISDIEPSHMILPVLLKKYIGQNARIIGFNVDPKFNDALDGLMITDVMDLPESSIYHQEDFGK